MNHNQVITLKILFFGQFNDNKNNYNQNVFFLFQNQEYGLNDKLLFTYHYEK